MEHKHICASICDRLPTLSTNHPWFVDHDLEDDNMEHILYTTRDPPSQHRCRIPLFLGRRIQGCFYGWVILSNHPHNNMWSLWNPGTCKIIRLPRLISKIGLGECCLSAPPDDPAGSILMITVDKSAIVFCRLDLKRHKLRWVEMSYAKQLKSVVGYDHGVLCCLTCCNGKVYALNSTVPNNYFVIHIDIVIKGRETVIRLLPYLKHPYCYINGCLSYSSFLKGCCTELFYVEIGLINVGYVENKAIGGVRVFKLDMTKMRWQNMEDLKGAVLFFDRAHGGCSIYYSPAAITTGGYAHFLDLSGKRIHSYDFKNKTIALSSMPTCHELLLERSRLHHGEIMSQQKEENKRKYMVVRGDVEVNNSNSIGTEDVPLLGIIPFDVLKTIMEFCFGVEYLNFRSTCKLCHLAAPMIRWRKGGRLRTYSLASPWLVVLDNEGGVISFTDPQFGDKYFIKTPQELIGDFEIHGSACGWLLIRRTRGTRLMFFNPFTGDIRVLPLAPYFNTCYFSTPPTSSDCMVVGFVPLVAWQVYIHFVARESSWRRFRLNFGVDDLQHSFHFATQYGHNNLYALYCNGGLGFIDMDKQDYTWQEGPSSSYKCPKHSFLMKCDQQLLLVKVGEFGECIEVFKMNDSKEWEKTESLGRHSIYVCGNACLCIEAKTPEMANKIYFPRLHSEKRKIVFYSLETRRYHTFNGQDTLELFGDFMGTEHHLDPHVWIEPSWL